MLSFGLMIQPILIILDEPTNHLDLDSVISLEKALKKAPCALLLVSHDKRLREELTSQTWHLSQKKEIIILNKNE